MAISVRAPYRDVLSSASRLEPGDDVLGGFPGGDRHAVGHQDHAFGGIGRADGDDTFRPQIGEAGLGLDDDERGSCRAPIHVFRQPGFVRLAQAGQPRPAGPAPSFKASPPVTPIRSTGTPARARRFDNARRLGRRGGQNVAALVLAEEEGGLRA